MSAEASSLSPAQAPSGSDSAEEFDLLLPLRSAGSLDNPYPIYSLLRSVRPVMQVPVPDWDGPGVWLLTRYRDAHFVLRDPRFSADRVRAPLVRENLDVIDEEVRRSPECSKVFSAILDWRASEPQLMRGID